MLYELITYYLGFQHHSGEGKIMGLSAYGRVDEEILPDWCDPEMGLPDVGRYRNYLAQRHQPRTDGAPLTQAHRDLAATVQSYYERSLVRIARMLFRSNGCKRFALAGGVALNCSGNGELAFQDFVESLFVQPASHDGGTALGAAILVHHELSGDWPLIDFSHAYLGPGYGEYGIRQTLDSAKPCYREVDPVQAIGKALLEDRVIGLFRGRAEVGPRALGNRVFSQIHKVPQHFAGSLSSRGARVGDRSLRRYLKNFIRICSSLRSNHCLC
jgi:carbamoyltransferase